MQFDTSISTGILDVCDNTTRSIPSLPSDCESVPDTGLSFKRSLLSVRCLLRNSAGTPTVPWFVWFPSVPLVVSFSPSCGFLQSLLWFPSVTLVVSFSHSCGFFQSLLWFPSVPLMVSFSPCCSFQSLLWFISVPLMVSFSPSCGFLQSLLCFPSVPLVVSFSPSCGFL